MGQKEATKLFGDEGGNQFMDSVHVTEQIVKERSREKVFFAFVAGNICGLLASLSALTIVWFLLD